MPDRYFPLMKILYIDLLSRRHQFFSILDSDASVRMISPKHITVELHLLQENTSLVSSVMSTICETSCVEV